MTAEPSLADRITDQIEWICGGRASVNEDEIIRICNEYEKRMADLEASNRNMASRLKKLMEKKS